MIPRSEVYSGFPYVTQLPFGCSPVWGTTNSIKSTSWRSKNHEICNCKNGSKRWRTLRKPIWSCLVFQQFYKFNQFQPFELWGTSDPLPCWISCRHSRSPYTVTRPPKEIRASSTSADTDLVGAWNPAGCTKMFARVQGRTIVLIGVKGENQKTRTVYYYKKHK